MDLSSDEEARRQAIAGARSLMSEEVLLGTLDLNGQIEVTEEQRGAVITIRYEEAVDVLPADNL
jgi:hypothetical protein